MRIIANSARQKVDFIEKSNLTYFIGFLKHGRKSLLNHIRVLQFRLAPRCKVIRYPYAYTLVSGKYASVKIKFAAQP